MQTCAHNEEVEQLGKHIESVSKLLVIKSATTGSRKTLESRFELEVGNIIRGWFKLLSELCVKSGVLERAIKLAKLIDAGKYTVAERENKISITLDSLIDSVESQFSRKNDIGVLHDIWQRYSKMAYTYGATTALKAMGFSVKLKTSSESEKAGARVIFELSDKEIIAALERRAVEFGAGLTQEIIEEAKGFIREQIFEGTGTIEDVAEAISDAEGIPDWRALKIARTETQAAFSKAMFDMYTRSGVLKKRWITVGDNRVRKWHVTNEGAGWIPIGASFPSGQVHPGDGVLSINCRCSMQADLSDPGILLVPWDGSEV